MKNLRNAAIAIILSAGFLSQDAMAINTNCVRQYMQDARTCSEESSFWGRSSCGLDAALDLAACVLRSLPRFGS